MRTLSAALLAGLLLPAALAAAPIRITGRVLHPPKDVQVELLPWAVDRAEALASTRPAPDGSFAIQVPASGFYSVVVRAEGRLALERSVPFVVEDVELPPVELPPASPPVQKESGEWHAAGRRDPKPDRRPAAGAPVRLSGRVLDAVSREPIPGALVWNGEEAWVRTSPSGAFELRAPSGDRGSIRATAAGRMIHILGWRSDRSTPFTFLLETAAPISGQVVDGQGRPVAGVRVATLVHPGEDFSIEEEERSATSGPDGRFLLKKLPARRPHWVEAVHEGYAPARQLADSTAPARLVLRRGALAVGRVVDDEGLPVDGARVSLDPVTEGEAPTRPVPFEATSDSAGRFRLPGVSAGWFTLRVERKGFADAMPSDVVVPEAEPQVDLGEIRLPAGGAIEGIVTDARERPVADAWIVLRPSGHKAFGAPDVIRARSPLRSGANGRFRVEDLPRGLRFDVQVQASGLLPAEATGVEVPTPQPLRIRLDLPRTLSGRVVDELGEPVAGAEIMPMMMTVLPDGGRQGQGIEQATTDPQGRFTVSLVRPGLVDIEAGAVGYRSRTVEVEVPEDGEPEPVEIVLEAGTSLEGRVLDSHGLPMDEAQVEARCRRSYMDLGSSGSTDEEGRYEIADLEPGACEVEALLFEQGRSLRVTAELRPGRNRLDLQFPAGFEVSGRVLDGRGEPLPGATLALAPLQPDGSQQEVEATSSADGSFVFADVPDGEYRLAGTRRGFGPAVHPTRIRVDGAPVGGLELRLTPGAVIRGRILGFRPEELRGAGVVAVSEQLGAPVPGTVSPGGAYRIDDVAPGEWHVSARIPPGISVEGTVEVADGTEEAVLDLELPPSFTLTGRVLLDREPLAGAGVTIVSPAGGLQRYGTTGQDGAFRVEHLPAGSYVLVVQPSPFFGDQRRLEIQGDLDVAVEISTGAVEGRVFFPDGLPAAKATVTLFSDIPGQEMTGVSGASAYAQSDERGVFELRAPAGTYRIFAHAEDGNRAEGRVVVTPGGTVHLDLALGVSP